ncbi:hypothetical protein [Streptomyces sp. NPDC002825]|uniref:hypothetical protein n=1 Tax=Streptomyces sp. NPDC002825 TaxID=3154666 RepID=UPI003329BA09
MSTPQKPSVPPQAAVPAQAAVPQQAPAPAVVRRPGTDSPWAARRPEPTERATSRLRRLVEGLPDWEPLPPGETLVRRPGTGR